MKQKVSDYMADFLANQGIRDVFTITGGLAMHMNDSFGHHPQLHCTYHHNEQGAAMAAEAYYRIDNKMSVVCVTGGPGATNAISGVAGAWVDSIPMLVLSGQVRYATTIYASDRRLRSRGFQEFDITGSVSNMTKYCELVTDANRIAYCMEKALYVAKEGRPGPCWLDIPLDVQGATIETEELEHFVPEEKKESFGEEVIDTILEKIKNGVRPVVFVGNGVRLADAREEFMTLIDKLNIPVITGLSSVDMVPDDHPLYAGRTGTTGDRAGNFAIQNSDVLLSLGSRLSFPQTGFNYKAWARCAYKMINEIDPAEIDKDSVNADLKLCGDVKELMQKLIAKLETPLEPKSEWIRQCHLWREKYPVVKQEYYTEEKPNPYAFFKELTDRMPSDGCLVVSVGVARIVGSAAVTMKEGMRFITNATMGAMGYDLPPAIGVCIARDRRKTVLVTGDGSLQMNIQEMQTIVQNKLPIAIFIMSNDGYNAIRNTQNAYFNPPLVGVGPESADLSFPDLSKLVPAYGMAFRRCDRTEDMIDSIEWAMQQEGPCLCEFMLPTKLLMNPKIGSRKLPNGQMVSAPLEDMGPVLPLEELKENMFIPLMKGYE